MEVEDNTIAGVNRRLYVYMHVCKERKINARL